MSFSAIQKILQRVTGLDGGSIGSGVVRRVVKRRMEITGVMNVAGYQARLRKDNNELRALIEDITVPETWFFRDGKPFELLAERVGAEWRPPSPQRVLRVLSIPCATGEEPYSIAMVLLDLGFDAQSVRIDAVDISKRALVRALAGEYRDNSFRGDEGHYRRRFFEHDGAIYKIKEQVRSLVSFWHGNLLDERFMTGAGLYDVIFCRNVMLYLTRELQERAIHKLHRLLSVDGLLFIGAGEDSHLRGDLFTSLGQSDAFVFRKRLSQSEPVKGAGTPAEAQTAAPPMIRRASLTEVAPGVTEQTAAVSMPAGEAALLAEVRRLADEGSLEEASRRCLAYLEHHTDGAEGCYLLGLIRRAEGKDIEAANLFRKVVNLDPCRYEALINLAELAEAQGNVAAAAVYRARAGRPKKPPDFPT